MGGGTTGLALRGGVVLAGLLPVAPVLAWSFELGSFRTWFWATSVPATVAIAVVAALAARRERFAPLRPALVAGVLGGIAGTIGYDVFRVPVAAITGLRLFAPIDSYGVLLTGADASSSWTTLAGWTLHFMNGIGFGVAYAAVAAGKRWWWGIAWGMVLEGATIVTPYAAHYGLAGQYDVIAIAFAAHVFYGAPLGRIVEDAAGVLRRATILTSRPAAAASAGLAVVLAVWFHPWTTPADVREARRLAPGAAAVVRDGRFVPEWLRVAPGGCATLRNLDPAAYTIEAAVGEPALGPAEQAVVCFRGTGIRRVRTSDTPYSGGFVIVDPEAGQ